MYTIIDGLTGSGKTYFMVNFLATKYYRFVDDVLDYVPTKDVRIISNIDGLNLDHVDLREVIPAQGTIDDKERDALIRSVFTSEFAWGGFEKKPVIYLIDEAQDYLHRKFYDRSVFLFLQKSRHFGVDIILGTQDPNTMCKEARVLADYTISAASRAERLHEGLFTYKWTQGGKKFKSTQLRFKREVALLYKSFEVGQAERVPRVYTRFLAIIAACLLLVVLASCGVVHWFKSGGQMMAHTKPLKASEEPRPAGAGSGKVLSPAEKQAELDRLKAEVEKARQDQKQTNQQVAEIIEEKPKVLRSSVVDGVTVYTYD